MIIRVLRAVIRHNKKHGTLFSPLELQQENGKTSVHDRLAIVASSGEVVAEVIYDASLSKLQVFVEVF